MLIAIADRGVSDVFGIMCLYCGCCWDLWLLKVFVDAKTGVDCKGV